MRSALHFDFRGCRALVTGGSSGIGLAAARAFRDAGAEVAITGRAARAEAYAVDLSGFEYHALELRDTPALEALPARFAALDVVVHCAGHVRPDGRDEREPEGFAQAVGLNLVAAYRVAIAFRALLAASAHEGGGCLVTLGSLSARRAATSVPGYAAAKAGLEQLTRSLAVAWAPERIRVNCVAPGNVATGMTAHAVGNDALERPLLERTPQRRWGRPEEIAPAILFLASSEARFVTGATLAVDGGYLAT